MENNKPRTIDEFFIEKYEIMERENEGLKEREELLNIEIKHLNNNINSLIKKYDELVERLKEDFGIKIRYSGAFPDVFIISSNNIIWENSDKEKFEYYKIIFNLKQKEEQGEKKDEQ